MLSFSIISFILSGFMLPRKASATMATAGTHPVMCLLCFSITPPFMLLFSSHQGLSSLHNHLIFCFHSLFLCMSFGFLVSLLLICSSNACFNFFICVVCHISVHVPPLPVTLPAQLPVACHQSCHSLPLRSFHSGLKPLLPISWIMDLLHTSCTSLCVYVHLHEWWETETEERNVISRHLECLASSLFSLKDVNGIQVNAPGTPRPHMHTDTHTLHSQACSNASLKAPELRGKPLWCLFYRVVKCWQLHIMETNRGAEFDASPGVIDECLRLI